MSLSLDVKYISRLLNWFSGSLKCNFKIELLTNLEALLLSQLMSLSTHTLLTLMYPPSDAFVIWHLQGKERSQQKESILSSCEEV